MLLFFTCVSIFLFGYSRNNNVTYNEDVVLVLGAGIKGETVTIPLKYRLDAAVLYTQKNEKALIVVSGGQGDFEDISEALAMERYLIQEGVDKNRIIKEDKSTSTYENIKFTKSKLDEKFGASYNYTVVIITNDFHIYRATSLAKELGVVCTHFYAKTSIYTAFINYARECLAVLFFWVF